VLVGLLRHDRAVVIAGLVLVIAIAWGYLLLGAGLAMPAAETMAGRMTMAPSWTLHYAALQFLMWAVMMAAMMLPSAAPVILIVAGIARKGAAAPSAASFALGYLTVWTGFSLLATALEWGLHQAGLWSPRMDAANAVLAGAVLIAAGIHQWTPLKAACLAHCRSPLAFLLAHWRGGVRGGMVLGLRHGLYCLGCCAMLMALLFVGGVMNLLWIAGIALLVLIEKLLPWGGRTCRLSGVVLALWGAATLAGAAGW
jgi:predicted metal-binding membrane protein